MTSDANAEGSETRSPEQIEADIERTRAEMGDTVEQLAAKTDVKARAKDKVEETKARVSEKVSGVADQAKQATPESASQGAQQAVTAAQENPEYVKLVGAFAAGALAGWILRGR